MRNAFVLDRGLITPYHLNNLCQWVKEQVRDGNTDVRVETDAKVILVTARGDGHSDPGSTP